MTISSCITIEPAALQRASRDLLRHSLALLDETRIPAPDTGLSFCVTQQGIERIVERATSLADDLHGLADALDSFLVRTFVIDGEIASVFDMLLAGSLS